MPLLLNEADVRRVLTMGELIGLMRDALVAFSRGDVEQPVRTVLRMGKEPPPAFLGLMPAYVGQLPALGAKLVTVFPRNAQRGLPSHLATILLLHPETGELLAIIDGRFITEARTAAVSAVSVEQCARAEADTLAILGSGVQARSHVEALRLVRRFRRIRVWSPTAGHLNEFVRETTASDGSVGAEAAPSAEAAVREADIIVLAVTSPVPVLENDWVQEGAHVISLGAIGATQREMDPALVARAHVIVDSRAAALVESGDIILGIKEGWFTEDHIRGELGELADGRVVGRDSPRAVTIFKSLGLAVEDVVAAHRVYERARASGLGTPL
jgi:ornithine cyclodeaminase